MKMNQDKAWLLRMAELEDGCDVSVGGEMNADITYRITEKGRWVAERMKDLCAQGHQEGPAFRLSVHEAQLWWKDKDPDEKVF